MYVLPSFEHEPDTDGSDWSGTDYRVHGLKEDSEMLPQRDRYFPECAMHPRLGIEYFWPMMPKGVFFLSDPHC